MPTTATAARPTERRTQEERTDLMRAKLLDATLEMIVREGWGNTSTAKICRQAGVSRGAQTHHFPSKSDLLVAAIHKSTDGFDELINDRLTDPTGKGLSIRQYLELMWDACIEGVFFDSWMEAMVAARTDQELHGTVTKVDLNSIKAMRSIGPRVHTDPRQAQLASDLVELSAYLLRGLAIQRGVHPDESERRRLFELWCDMVDAKLEGAN